jgi:hypothetical protein
MNNRGANLLQVVFAVFIIALAATMLGAMLSLVGKISHDAHPDKVPTPAYVSAPMMRTDT